MATTLGGVTLAQPKFYHEGYEVEMVDNGAFHNLADGSVVYDYVNSRFRVTLRWEGLTSAEKGTIQTRALVKTAQAFVADNGDSWTVLVVPNSWRYSYQDDGDATERYKAELRLEESTA